MIDNKILLSKMVLTQNSLRCIIFLELKIREVVKTNMEIQIEENIPDYVNEAVLAVEKILTENKCGVVERLMRLTKGEVLVLKILIQSGTSI